MNFYTINNHTCLGDGYPFGNCQTHQELWDKNIGRACAYAFTKQNTPLIEECISKCWIFLLICLFFCNKLFFQLVEWQNHKRKWKRKRFQQSPRLKKHLWLCCSTTWSRTYLQNLAQWVRKINKVQLFYSILAIWKRLKPKQVGFATRHWATSSTFKNSKAQMRAMAHEKGNSNFFKLIFSIFNPLCDIYWFFVRCIRSIYS